MKQNDKLSLCRKFSKWIYFHDENIYRILFILFIVLCIIICITIYNKYGYGINSYDESNYKYLTAIVYTIWDEDTKSLKLEYIPDNVSITEAAASPSGANFKCNLISKNPLIPAPFVNVYISEDFNIEVTHYTENEFRSSARIQIVLFCAACCALWLLIEIVVWLLIRILVYFFCGLYDLTKKFVTNLNRS